jgi:hypothetical protein
MIEYKMVGVDERKAQLIKRMGDAPNADEVVPTQDRVIIADLVISGIEKMLATINAHLDMSAKVLSGEGSRMALDMFMAMEMCSVAESIVNQLGEQILANILEMGCGDRLLRDMQQCGFPVTSIEDLLKLAGSR